MSKPFFWRGVGGAEKYLMKSFTVVVIVWRFYLSTSAVHNTSSFKKKVSWGCGNYNYTVHKKYLVSGM